MKRALFNTVFLLLPLCLMAQEQEITVDLHHPTYKGGVLTTEEGGVIQADGVRIQGQSMVYTRTTSEEGRVVTVEASGDLMLEYGDYVFVGDELFYDFVTRSGYLTLGRSAMGPWFVGGEIVRFQPDGSYLIEKAYITTCENLDCEWKLQADCVTIRNGTILLANSVTVRFLQIPVFWLPNFRTNLARAMEMPISYRGQVGGAVGSFVGLRYRFLSWGGWDMFLRAEYFIDRGPGGGIDLKYENDYRCARLLSQNYVARDRSINDPRLRTRYRFGGVYCDQLRGGDVKINARWDKLSDSEMAPDYFLDDFNLRTARRTQIDVRHQRCNSTTNFFTTLRLNGFQSINQELPTLEQSWRPLSLGDSGVVVDGRVRLSYLDYVFAKETPQAGFHSARLQLLEDTYRPFQLGNLRAVPHLGGTVIFYSESPLNTPQTLLTGNAGLDLSTRLSRCYGRRAHVVEPYLRFNYWTSPSSTIPQHYLFSIEDAWIHLNMFRLGTQNLLLSSNRCAGSCTDLNLDLYTYGFFNNQNIIGFTPKLYLDASFTPIGCIDVTIDSAWDFAHNRLDHGNLRLSYTHSENVAVALEVRHRSAYAWKKSDYENFVLDTFYPEPVLLQSGLSDRRNTVLFHAFFRLTPNVSFEIETRHGWDRRATPDYNEGKVAALFPLRCRWYLRLAYEHTEFDDQFSMSLSLGKWRRPRAIRALKTELGNGCWR